MLQLIDDTGSGVLVLMDDLSEDDFRRSRLTRSEVCRQLKLMAQTLLALPVGTRSALAEIDWAGWRALALALGVPTGPSGELGSADDGPQRLLGATQSADDAAWFAVRALVPATLSWLRVYRQQEPALFSFKP